jgi:hypothetical protein
MSNQILFGYKPTSKGIVKHPVTSAIVLWVFESASQGYSYTRILQALQSHQNISQYLFTTHGKPWTPTHIRKLLAEPQYYKGDASFEPIISSSLWGNLQSGSQSTGRKNKVSPRINSLLNQIHTFTANPKQKDTYGKAVNRTVKHVRHEPKVEPVKTETVQESPDKVPENITETLLTLQNRNNKLLERKRTLVAALENIKEQQQTGLEDLLFFIRAHKDLHNYCCNQFPPVANVEALSDEELAARINAYLVMKMYEEKVWA